MKTSVVSRHQQRDEVVASAHAGRRCSARADVPSAVGVASSPRMLAQRKQLQAAFGAAIQRMNRPEDDEQGTSVAVQRREANGSGLETGLPDNLKAGVESLSGVSLDHVKVHYNSAQPAELNGHAYAQGNDIHLAPGAEQHLPHEAWHVVQQAQGRVRPTAQLKRGVPLNDDAGLEHEADVMGAKALQIGSSASAPAIG